jgi:hypothetical protein
MSDQMPTRQALRSARSLKTILRALAATAALAAAMAGGIAYAAPATLANDADVTAFAQRMKAYRDASRVHWVVAASTRAAAEAVIANISLHLEDRNLISRVSAQSFADSPEIAPGATIPVAWIAPQTMQAPGGQKCSWQVWVTDPSLPSPGPGGVSLPLASGDRLPVGADATFRVGYTGLLQSKLYAFDETQPGAIRDLAAAPDVNIPVATGRETIVLAMARHPAPFLDGIRTALASSAGERRDLGKEYALASRFVRTRQIGANLQLVAPDMVLAKHETGGTRQTPVARAGDGQVADELTETCLYYMTPMMTQ